MLTLTAERLIAAAGDDAEDAGITIHAELEPLAGAGSPVKPATYLGGVFQADRRWYGEGDDRRPIDVLVIDNEPSQANRLEAALEGLRDQLRLPEIVLDLSSLGTLPPHLPRRISSFRFPHRNADAYLRDAMLDGQRFLVTEVGRAVFDATADRPEALFAWFPQALLFGFWQSHLGKKRSQAKLARAWVSEVVGVDPAARDVRRLGLKGDPLNLNVTDAVAPNETSAEDWGFADKGGKKLADVGHGQVPVKGEDAAPAGVSFRTVEQRATVSFASLRRVRPAQGAAEGRALLAVLGLVAHVTAFGRSFSLRSGADLRPLASAWSWLSAGERLPVQPLDLCGAVALFQACAEAAADAGLPVGRNWPAQPLVLQPADNLAEAIRKSWPSN